MKIELEQYRMEMQQELENILAYWMQFTIDRENGGFVGKIDHANNVFADAPKGSVLNSRILWTFSCAYNLTKNTGYLAIAERAFYYLDNYFIDKEFGGVYWTVDHTGKPLDRKKQMYALAFAVYGLSEFYLSSKNEKAREVACSLYQDIITHSYDEKNGGYIEALTRDWQQIGDLRLSARDANEKKSMNTHLHILEAFTNLYRARPDETLRQRIVELIHIFLDHIISAKTGHLILFFDDEWNERSGIISYGHDIEAAWLLQEAAEVTGDKSLLCKVKEQCTRLVKAAAKGVDADGGLWYEYDGSQQNLITQKHSWPQAEAMIGFFNAWQITGETKYLELSLCTWQFVQKYIVDKEGGEWVWGVRENYSPMNEEDKVGIWKCPYHNSRACMEIIKRIDFILDKQQS